MSKLFTFDNQEESKNFDSQEIIDDHPGNEPEPKPPASLFVREGTYLYTNRKENDF